MGFSFEALTQGLAAREAEIADALLQDWEDLARGIACEGHDADLAETLDELKRVGRTVDDLKTVCELAERRRSLADAAGQVATATREHSTARAALTVEHERFTALETAHKAAVHKLERDASRAGQAMRAGAEGRRELLRTCSQQMRSAMLDIRAELDPLANESSRLQGVIDWNADRLMATHQTDGTRDATAAAQTALAELKPKIAELRKKLAELERDAMHPNSVDVSAGGDGDVGLPPPVSILSGGVFGGDVLD